MLNSTHHCFMKIPNKRELQQIACDHLSDIDFKGFINLYHIFFKLFMLLLDQIIRHFS